MKSIFFYLAILLTLCFPLPAKSLTYVSEGDSLSECLTGPTTPAKCWVQLLAGYLGATLNNQAHGGQQAAETAVVADGMSFAGVDIVTLMIGINDSLPYTTAAQQEFYRGFLLETAIRSTYPSRIYPAAMTKTGTWGNRFPDSRIPWSQGVYSNTAGSTITATVSGSTVYVGSDYQTGVTGSAQVSIDGTVVGTFTDDGTGMTTHNGLTYAPYALRYNGLSAGSHTVQITLLSGFIYLEHITGSNQPQGPTLYLMTPTRNFPISPASNIALIAIVNDTKAKLAADGRNVVLVDSASQIVASDTIDGLHLNDAANARLAIYVRDIILGTPPPPTYNPSVIEMDAAGNFFGRLSTDSGGSTRKQLN